MADVTSTVRNHYTLGTLLERIVAFLEENGVDPDHPRREDLYPFDQLHGRGIEATREHIAFAGIARGMRVLDLGCGVGGASRAMAATCEARVTGIDLTPEYVAVARELTARCGMAPIEFLEADALGLPFDGASFDRVWCHNVTMNIADKAGLAREAARVLVPGGRFSCAEIGQGPAGAPSYPLPWAADPSSSFLATPDQMREALEAGGLRVIDRVDLTEVNLAFRMEMIGRAERGAPPLTANQVVMGDDFPDAARNTGMNMEEGRLVEHMMLAEKP